MSRVSWQENLLFLSLISCSLQKKIKIEKSLRSSDEEDRGEEEEEEEEKRGRWRRKERRRRRKRRGE